MVKTLKVKKEQAETAKLFLAEKGWLDKTRVIGKTPDRYVIFPLAGKYSEDILKKKFAGSKFEEKNLQIYPPRTGNLKFLLKGVIPDKYVDKVVRSFDVIGDIAILEIFPELENFELQIAHALKLACPYIHTFVRKAGKISDEYRLRPLKHLTGERKTETVHSESGIKLKLDIAKVYFSPRSSGERMRIARMVKPNEKVLVMFAGIGPFALMIAKEQPNCKVWAVELNPDAVRYMHENIRMNRAGHIVKAVLGDVQEEVPKIGELFDRIVMPYPEKSWDFLELAVKYAAPEAVIHFYAFVKEEETEKKFEKIAAIAKKQKREIEILNWLRAGSYAPRVWRTCFDVLVK